MGVHLRSLVLLLILVLLVPVSSQAFSFPFSGHPGGSGGSIENPGTPIPIGSLPACPGQANAELGKRYLVSGVTSETNCAPATPGTVGVATCTSIGPTCSPSGGVENDPSTVNRVTLEGNVGPLGFPSEGAANSLQLSNGFGGVIAGPLVSAFPTLAGSNPFTGDISNVGGNVSFVSAGSTIPNRAGTSLPATCVVNETFVLTSAPNDQRFYLCTATNVWTLQSGGGAALAADGEVNAAKAVNAADPRVDPSQTEVDVVVNLSTGVNWTTAGASTVFANPWAQLQAAVNPFLLDPTVPRTVRCVGSADATLADLRPIRYWNGTASVEAPMDAGLVIAPALSVDPVTAMPVIQGTMGSNQDAMLQVYWQGCRIKQTRAGQTRPHVYLLRGGAFFGGKDVNGGNVVVTGGKLAFHGTLTLGMADIVDGGWTPGRPIVMNATTIFTSPTTAVGIWDDGYTRNHTEQESLHLIGVPGVDDDDVGILQSDVWGRYRGGVRVQDWGVGVLSYGNVVGGLRDSYVSQNGVNLQFGDPVNGCKRSYIATCASGDCSQTGVLTTCTGFTGRDSVFEGARTGPQLITYGPWRRILFDAAHFEASTPIATTHRQICLGCGVCGSGTLANLSCAKDSDCGSAGEVCNVAGGLNHNLTFRGGVLPNSGDVLHSVVLGKGLSGQNTDSFVAFESLRKPGNVLFPLFFDYDLAANIQVTYLGSKALDFPPRYDNYRQENLQWCELVMEADAAGNLPSGIHQCPTDRNVTMLRAQCSTSNGSLTMNIEQRPRTQPNLATGVDSLVSNLTCTSPGIAIVSDSKDPSVATVWTDQVVGGSLAMVPIVKSETLGPGDWARIQILYRRDE